MSSLSTAIISVTYFPDENDFRLFLEKKKYNTSMDYIPNIADSTNIRGGGGHNYST